MRHANRRRYASSALAIVTTCLFAIPVIAQSDVQPHALEAHNPLPVEFSHVGTLGEPSGGGMLCHQRDFAIARDKAGRYFVNTNCDCGRIQVFGPDFEYLKTIGSCGQGPGELEHVVALAADETLYAVGASSRVIRFSADLDNPTTIMALGRPPVSAAVTTTGNLAFNYFRYTDVFIERIHTHAPDGELLQSCAPTRMLAPRQLEEITMMGVVSDRQGGVWAIPFGNRYRIYHCTPELTEILRRPADWFPDYVEESVGHRPAVNPRGFTFVNGLLWVVVYVPTEWIDEARPASEDVPELYQVIDVIEPNAGVVVGHAKIDLPGNLKIIGWVDDLAYAFSDTQDGGWVLEFYEARLVH